LNTEVSEGNVATRLKFDGIFIRHFIANLLLSLTVKRFWKYVVSSS